MQRDRFRELVRRMREVQRQQLSTKNGHLIPMVRDLEGRVDRELVLDDIQPRLFLQTDCGDVPSAGHSGHHDPNARKCSTEGCETPTYGEFCRWCIKRTKENVGRGKE